MKALLANLDNRINPIVIKELRQAVNGRFVSALLMLFLLISVLIYTIIAAQTDDRNAFTGSGQDLLMAMQSILDRGVHAVLAAVRRDATGRGVGRIPTRT